MARVASIREQPLQPRHRYAECLACDAVITTAGDPDFCRQCRKDGGHLLLLLGPICGCNRDYLTVPLEESHRCPTPIVNGERRMVA